MNDVIVHFQVEYSREHHPQLRRTLGRPPLVPRPPRYEAVRRKGHAGLR